MEKEAEGLPQGIIIKGIGGFYYVATNEGIYECKARGRFRKDEIIPLPGDRVSLSAIDTGHKKGFIDAILERESVLTRPAVANINQLIAVIAVKSPDPDFLLLDKLIITAEKKSIETILCINKIDLDPEGDYIKLSAVYAKAGYTVITTSVKTGSGFDLLKSLLKGRITVFAGQSGVGKSTLLNKIINSQVMETGEISGRTLHGRHTTRHAELVALGDGGYLVDTPGFSSFELSGLESAELQEFFPEFEDFRFECRFKGCSHVSEPDCKIKQAVEDGIINKDRYDRYVALYSSLKELNSRIYK